MESKTRGAEYLSTKSAGRHIKELALRGGAAMVLSRSTSAVVQFGSSIVLARLLEPTDFGLFAMVTAFSLLLANVGYNGFMEAIVQADEIDHHQVSALFWLGFGISLGLAILFSAFSPLLANLYKEPRLVSIAVALSIGFIFNALTTTHLALIMRRIEFRKVMLNEVISVVVSNTVAVVMAFSGFGYWVLVVRQLASMLLSAVIVWIQCPWRPSLPRRTSRMKQFIKYAASTFGNYGITYMGRNLDKVLIGWRWGSQELGNYDRAYQLFVMPVGQMVTPLAGVALATLSRLRNDPEKYRRYFLRSLSIIAFVGMLMSTILTVAGQDIIIFLLGKQWVKAGEIFTAFGPSIGITLIYGTHSWLHLSLGRPERWLRWSLAALAVTALMFLIGLEFGGLGIAVAYGLSFYLLVGAALGYAGRPIGIRTKHIWEQLWKYYVASVLSGSVVWVALVRGTIFGSPTGGLPLLLKILAVSLACAVLYLLAVLALYRDAQPFKDLIMVIKEVVPRRKPISKGATNGTL